MTGVEDYLYCLTRYEHSGNLDEQAYWEERASEIWGLLSEIEKEEANTLLFGGK